MRLRLKAELRRLAMTTNFDIIILISTYRHIVMWQVRERCCICSQLFFDICKLSINDFNIGRNLFHGSDFFRCITFFTFNQRDFIRYGITFFFQVLRLYDQFTTTYIEFMEFLQCFLFNTTCFQFCGYSVKVCTDFFDIKHKISFLI